MSKYCSLTRILLPIHIACQIYTLLKTLFHISYLHGRFFWEIGIYTQKMSISFLLILQNCQLIMIMWFQYYFHHIIIVMLTICQLILVNSPMFPYVLVSLWSVYIVTFTLWSSYFPLYPIYRPRFCPFVHFVIVPYCIYAFWVVSTREINLRSTTSTAGWICWKISNHRKR